MVMESIIQFLRNRGAPEDCLERMIADKIDSQVILLLDDTELTSYVPQYGDRVALKAFCREKTPGHSRKDVLLENLRSKIALKRSQRQPYKSPEIECDNTKKEVASELNSKKKKNTRRIELGMVMFNKASNSFKHVRQQTGGGIRNLSVDMSTSMQQLLPVALDIFFPDGVSVRGNINSFTAELLDYKMQTLNYNSTVIQLYQDSKMKMLRVHLAIRPKENLHDFGSTTVVESVEMDDSSDFQNTPACPWPCTISTGSPVSNQCVQINNELELSTRSVSPVHSSPVHSFSLVAETTMQTYLDELPDLDASDTDVTGHTIHNPVQINDLNLSQSSQLNMTVVGEATFHEVLLRLSSAVDKSVRKNIVNVDREDVLDGGFRAFQRPTFDPRALLSVRFAGEDGIDSGGLTREFLRLALFSVRSLSIFQGPENAKHIALDYRALGKGTYRVVGRLMAYSIVHNGPLPAFLDVNLYTAIADGCENVKPGIDDVYDATLRNQLIEVLNSTDDNNYRTLLIPLEDTLILAGCLPFAQHFKDREQLVTSLCHFLTIGRASGAIKQFQEGLELLGVLRCVRENSTAMTKAFVYCPEPLDATTMENLFLVSWSPKDSNRYRQEKKTWTHWSDLLQDLENTQQLDTLLIFATGLDCIPPLGFDAQPTITFGHKFDLDANDVTRDYPFANTCANTLRLPLVETYELFKDNFLSALKLCKTFSAK